MYINVLYLGLYNNKQYNMTHIYGKDKIYKGITNLLNLNVVAKKLQKILFYLFYFKQRFNP